MAEHSNIVGKRIREARKLLKMTQKELGDACGIASQTIGQYERGTLHPKIDTLFRLAMVLDVPLDWITGDTRLSRVEAAKRNNDYRRRTNAYEYVKEIISAMFGDFKRRAHTEQYQGHLLGEYYYTCKVGDGYEIALTDEDISTISNAVAAVVDNLVQDLGDSVECAEKNLLDMVQLQRDMIDSEKHQK